MIVDNVGTFTSHASNESLNVELVNDSISKTPSVKQTQVHCKLDLEYNT